MPRRRAVRIMVAGVAAATLPSWRPGRALARRRAGCPPGDQPCGTGCCTRDTFCASTSPPSCCSIGTTYCPGTATHPGTCCNPGEKCNASGGCCPGGQDVCGAGCCPPDKVCGDARTGLCCLPGQEACGIECCAKGATCARASISLCCKRGEDPCEGPHGKVTCCDAKHACCKGKCCPKGHICEHGKCTKCPTGLAPCGDETCCEPRNCCGSQCCGGLGYDCAIRRGEKTCCLPGSVTRAHGRKFCCPSHLVPRRGTCCPEAGPCVCGDLSCLPGTYCDDGKCVAI
jgi:hypothetical protein